MTMPNLIERARAALKAFRFPVYPTSVSSSFGAQVFWPDWPSQVPCVGLGEPDLTESSLIMAAVNWAGTQFAEPPPRVIEKRGDEWVPIDHPLPRLVERPNKYYSGATMFKGFAYYWLVNGNVYWFKMRDKAGRITALWLLDSEQCEPAWPDDGSEFISHYEIRVDGKLSRLEVRDVIHFRYGIDPRNHRKGLAPLRALVEEVIADEAAISYSKAAMGSLGVPPFIVSPKPNADSVYTIDAEKVKEMLMSRTVGGERGKPIVFSAPMDIAQLGFNPGQMSLKEIHSLPEERVAAVLGIPAMVLGYGAGLEHSHYSNYESALKAAWNGFVIPTMKVIASELGHQLLPDYYNPREKERWVEFDTSEVWALQEDEKSIAEREVLKWNSGLTTRNEARGALGLEPLPDGDKVIELPVQAAPIEQKQLNLSEPAQYEELRDWWEKFGPREAREILDATELEK